MSADYAIVLPEIILAIAAMALLMFGAYGGEDRKAPLKFDEKGVHPPEAELWG